MDGVIDAVEETDFDLTLFFRSADRLPDNPRVTKIGASVADAAKLEEAVKVSQVVFAALSGDLPTMAKQIIAAMKKTGANRLVFISSYGIYGEIAGNPGNVGGMLRPYRKAADIVEESGLNYTTLRLPWLNDRNEFKYTVTHKDKEYVGVSGSRQSMADFVLKIIKDPDFAAFDSIGLAAPDTQGKGVRYINEMKSRKILGTFYF